MKKEDLIVDKIEVLHDLIKDLKIDSKEMNTKLNESLIEGEKLRSKHETEIQALRTNLNAHVRYLYGAITGLIGSVSYIIKTIID